MKKFYSFLACFILASSFLNAQVINELDADQTGTDSGEFIEILWTPNTALDGLVVVFYNGSNDQSYAAYDLDGYSTDANGFFIMGNPDITSGSDLVFANNGLQNGADAVAIYTGNDTDFPNNTPVTMVNLVDALVYGTGDSDDAELLTGLGETVQYDESANGASATESIQRKTDGTYETKAPTFRASNAAAVCAFSVTSSYATCDAFTTGTDTYTASFNFAGGLSESFVINTNTGTISGDDPNSVETGTLTITGINEGTDVTLTVTSSLCNVSEVVVAPVCEPSASFPIYEPFDYADNANLGDQGSWINVNSGDEILVQPGSLSYSGLAASTGNSIFFSGAGLDPYYEFTPVTSGAVYASFILNVTSISVMTDLTDGGYFAGLAASQSSYDGRLWVRPNPDADSGTYDFGFGSASTNPPFTTSTYSVGQPVFIVMSYDLDTAELNLWVNPDYTTFGTSTPPTATMTDIDASAASEINRFMLRQDSPGETPQMTFDELRISDNWADVTPAGPLAVENFSNTTFKVYPNPVNNGIVNIKSNNAGDVHVTLFNMLGKQVVNTTLTNEQLNVSNLNKGIYLLKVTQGNTTTTQKLVIK